MPAETIFDALRDSHDEQRSLCRRLLRTKAGTVEQRDLFTALRIELAAHAAAEERYLYAPILMDDAGLHSSRHALHEHHQIDELIEDLQSLKKRGDAWLETARALSKKVHHHLREEETKFFQVSGKILSNGQKAKLARAYRKDLTRMKKSLAA